MKRGTASRPGGQLPGTASGAHIASLMSPEWAKRRNTHSHTRETLMEFIRDLQETIGLKLPTIILTLYTFAVVFTVVYMVVLGGGSNG